MDPAYEVKDMFAAGQTVYIAEKIVGGRYRSYPYKVIKVENETLFIEAHTGEVSTINGYSRLVSLNQYESFDVCAKLNERLFYQQNYHMPNIKHNVGL